MHGKLLLGISAIIAYWKVEARAGYFKVEARIYKV